MRTLLRKKIKTRKLELHDYLPCFYLQILQPTKIRFRNGTPNQKMPSDCSHTWFSGFGVTCETQQSAEVTPMPSSRVVDLAQFLKPPKPWWNTNDFRSGQMLPPVAGTHPATWKFLAPSILPHSPAILEVNLPVDRLPGLCKSTTRQGCFPSCKCDTGDGSEIRSSPVEVGGLSRYLQPQKNPTSLQLY